jgi:hypothetical protein
MSLSFLGHWTDIPRVRCLECYKKHSLILLQVYGAKKYRTVLCRTGSTVTSSGTAWTTFYSGLFNLKCIVSYAQHNNDDDDRGFISLASMQ